MTEKKINIHQDLIDACRKYDRTAQVKIYELYYKAMYNTSYRILNNPGEAEDAMQDAFLDAFRKLDTYKAEAPFGAWLKRIVINKSLDALKKKKEFALPDSIENELPDTSTDEFEEGEQNTMRVTEVKNAMEKLAVHYRIILSLFLLEGYDHQEIAEVLNISYANVRVRYKRAKSKLLEELQRSKSEYLETLKN